MSPKPDRPQPAARSQRLSTPGASRLPMLIVGAGVLVVVVVAALLAIALSAPPVSHVPQPAASVVVDGQPLAALTPDGNDAAVGQQIPTLTGTDLGGSPMTISPEAGPLAIVVLAHWCPHCQAEVPRIVDYLAADQAPSGVKIVALTTAISSTRPNFPPSAWLEREEWAVPTLVDDAANSALTALGVPSFPAFIFVDADGRVAGRLTGEIGTERFDAALQAIAP